MNNNMYFVPASGCSNPFHQVDDMIKRETEETFEFGIKVKGRNVFWILYLTDKLSDSWGFTVMIGDWTIINYCKTNEKESQS